MRVRQARRTVLVVDDEPTIARIVGLHLKRAGFEVLVFTSPEAVITYFDQFSDRVVALVTDVSMPMLDGVELAAQLRKNRQELPVLFLTGHSHLARELVVQTGGVPSEGPNAVLTKPFGRLDLVRELSRLLGWPLAGSRPNFPAIAS